MAYVLVNSVTHARESVASAGNLLNTPYPTVDKFYYGLGIEEYRRHAWSINNTTRYRF